MGIFEKEKKKKTFQFLGSLGASLGVLLQAFCCFLTTQSLRKFSVIAFPNLGEKHFSLHRYV